jgi:archaellum component FlaG (FlaF/FlaG flagellin family)
MSGVQSPLAGLILFIVCLAIAGTVVAGGHYMVIDRPAQVLGEQEQGYAF